MSPAHKRFERFCWLALVLVVGVILWGAYVRASGSGAGCGSHWPTCDGEVIPRSIGEKKAVELFHRVTSGLSAIAVLVQLIWGFRLYPWGHRVRRALGWSGLFMLGEVLIGAGIVLLKYVADDQSVGRAVWMAVHLVNTFLLVGAMTLAAHFAGGSEGARLRNQRGGAVGLVLASIVATLMVGMSGAIAALGDTLFPATSLSGALAADLSPTAHVLVRLRVAHPFVAIGTAMLLLFMRFWVASQREGEGVSRYGLWLNLAVYAQLAVGVANIALLAPIWMQIVHLLLAQLLWIALVLFSVAGLRATPHDELPAEPGAEPGPARPEAGVYAPPGTSRAERG